MNGDTTPPAGEQPRATLALARAGGARVRTPQQLRLAMLQPAEHIIIEEHMSFVGTNDTVALLEGLPYGRESATLFLVHPTTRSIQVRAWAQLKRWAVLACAAATTAPPGHQCRYGGCAGTT